MSPSADVLTDLAPHFFQVAYVVRDLATSEAFFRRTMGVRHFERMDGVELGEGCSFRGGPSDATLDLSIGYLGDTQIELVHPGRGNSLHAEFLAAGNVGLHHLGFLVPEFDKTVAELRAGGLEPASAGRLDTGMVVDFAYFDIQSDEASCIEILGFDENAHAFMSGLKEKG